jgi:hypothetical protein
LLRWGLAIFLHGLDSNLNSSDIHLLSSWYYRCETQSQHSSSINPIYGLEASVDFHFFPLSSTMTNHQYPWFICHIFLQSNSYFYICSHSNPKSLITTNKNH